MNNGQLEAAYYFMQEGYVDISYEGDFYSIYYDFTDDDGTSWRAIFEGEFKSFTSYVSKPFSSNLTGNINNVPVSVAAYYREPSEYESNPRWVIYMLDEGTTYDKSEYGYDILGGTGGFVKMELRYNDYTGIKPTELPVGTFTIEHGGGLDTCIAGYAPGNWSGSWYFSAIDRYAPETLKTPVVGGTLTIAKSGTGYTITLNGLDDTMPRVNGPFSVGYTYTGNVNYY